MDDPPSHTLFPSPHHASDLSFILSHLDSALPLTPSPPHLVLPDFPGSRQWLPAWWVHVVSPKPHPHSRSWDIGAPLRRGRPVKMPQPPISIWVGNIISTLHDWWACLNASYAVCRAPALPPSLVWGVPCARENSLPVLTAGGIAELSHLRPPILGSASVQINQESKRTQKEEWFVP